MVKQGRQAIARSYGSTMRRHAAVVVGVVLALALAGCAPVRAELADAAAQGRSAVRTAELALETEAEGQAGFGVVPTALTDAARELQDAATMAAETSAGTASERNLRAETLSAIRAGQDAVTAAQQSLDGLASAEVAADDLAAADDVLDELASAGGQ